MEKLTEREGKGNVSCLRGKWGRKSGEKVEKHQQCRGEKRGEKTSRVIFFFAVKVEGKFLKK